MKARREDIRNEEETREEMRRLKAEGMTREQNRKDEEMRERMRLKAEEIRREQNRKDEEMRREQNRKDAEMGLCIDGDSRCWTPGTI